MSRLLQLLKPRHIGAQIALLVVTALVISQVVSAAAFFLLNRHGDLTRPRVNFAKLVVVARLLAAEDRPEARAQIVAAVHRNFPELMFTDDPVAVGRERVDDHLLGALQHELGEQFAVFTSAPQGPRADGTLRIGIRLPDGTALAAALPQPGRSPILISTLVSLATAITLLSLWAARALAAPLKAFADAAENFTVGRSDAPLTEQGPVEIRRAARSLNEMQRRIRRMVEDRTWMLATVGHDLRTPITRLRLRAEEIEPECLRREVIHDLDTMRDMVHSALSFLRDQSARMRVVRTELSSLIQTLCDGFCDLGYKVEFVGPLHVEMNCDPEQLSRALANLIDNGVKFGNSVTVELKNPPRAIIVEVKDDGPGISDADKGRVMEPFFRGEASLAPDRPASFGLGLSIARSVAENHGGTLELCDGSPMGLVARLTIPAQESADPRPLALQC